MNQKTNNKPEWKLEKSILFWCKSCNLPLLEEKCGICQEIGLKLELSEQGDVRFCSQHEKTIINDLMLKDFGVTPFSEKIVLLNKISGEDKTDEIIVDGFIFGILRFDMKELDFKLDLSNDGAISLINSKITKKLVKISSSGRHLSGKNIDGKEIIECSHGIDKGDTVLVSGKNIGGFGVSLRYSGRMKQEGEALKIKKVSSNKVYFNPKISSIDDVISANSSYMKRLVKDGINTIRGIANQKDFKDLPVYVSFSGGKDSLVTLDLTMSAVKKIKVFFANTGIEFPETVKFVRNFCNDKNIELIEVGVKDAFWEALSDFGPPAKDFRWCCKVCKLAPINSVIEECAKDGKCLTIDGKRKYESFMRSKIAPKEENPFIPSQVSVFPIRNWRAIEVWLYIYYRKLEYNPLYELGFERVGCWLCPSELSAEYYRFKELHPLLFEKWNNYLLNWASEHGVSEEFIKHGFWRWKSLPPKMMKLANELGINTVLKSKDENFSIVATGGVSPCKSGGYTMEGKLKGVLVDEIKDIANILGEYIFSYELGLILITSDKGSVKIFSSGHISVNALSEDKAVLLFGEVSEQIIRLKKCTKCGVCLKVCKFYAVSLEPNFIVNEKCNRCGKCSNSCVVVKYFK